MHKAKHFYDDLAKGFPGWEVLLVPHNRWKMEYDAYMEEIKFLKKHGEYETAKKLLENAQLEKESIEKLYNVKL